VVARLDQGAALSCFPQGVRQYTAPNTQREQTRAGKEPPPNPNHESLRSRQTPVNSHRAKHPPPRQEQSKRTLDPPPSLRTPPTTQFTTEKTRGI